MVTENILLDESIIHADAKTFQKIMDLMDRAGDDNRDFRDEAASENQ